MKQLNRILQRAAERPHALSRNDLITLLGITAPAERQALHAAAYAVKVHHIGHNVSLRGIIEMGNICSKGCLYCGIRRGNTAIKRFALDEEEIIAAVHQNSALSFGSLVLQSGEIESEAHTAFIEQLLRRIRHEAGPEIGITLSLGEQSHTTYSRWRAAGAQRYLLRIETSNRDLYARIHPAGHEFERRLAALRSLRECNYQVGSGVMIGLPGQSLADLADDILFFASYDLDMIGMGPYIPHPDTPLGATQKLSPEFGARQLELGLNMIAVTRLYLHDTNIAATTALQALGSDGRERGILAGANVIMPNITDTKYRENYQLYANKPNLDESAVESRNTLERQLHAIGEKILWNRRGDSPHYFTRNQTKDPERDEL